MARQSVKHLTKKERKSLKEGSHAPIKDKDNHLMKEEPQVKLEDKLLGKTQGTDKSSLGTFKGKICYDDGEPLVTLRGARTLSNLLIDEGSTTLDICMAVLQHCNKQWDKPITLVPCSFCGIKFGVKRCSGCSRTDAEKIRYCSSECQAVAWPVHKTICVSRQTIDVE